MRFETDGDLDREEDTIRLFCNKFNLRYLKLGMHDVDFKVYNQKTTGYVEVKGRNKNYQDAFPLPVAARKVLKLADKKSPSVIIWDCFDCIIYGNTSSIVATARMGGRKPRDGSHHDQELMLYYEKQNNLKVIYK